MSLRHKFILYLSAVHLVFAALAIPLLMKYRPWLLAAEVIFILSFLCGLRLVRHLFGTLELIQTGAELMNEKDFTTRFREVGQPEMDALIGIYNRMIDHLREERLRAREQHYFLESILQVSPSAVITLDYDERIAVVNPSGMRMLQLPSETLIGFKLSEVASPFVRALDELKLGESRVLPLRGSRRVKCYKSQFLDRGFARGFFLLEELTEELRQSEKAAYEKLIRMMSHEVNNSVGSANSLLHSCLNYAGQLQQEDRRDFETALHVVIARTEQLNLFMKSFADVVRLPPPTLQPCDVKEPLEAVRVLFGPQLLRQRIAWNWQIEERLPPFAMDRAQIEQVIVNIVKNAIEAVGEDGVITVRMGRRAGRAHVVIADSGEGIAAAVESQLFSPFFSTKKNGQGIGLTVVQEILHEHHFEFSLESQPGGPTEFTIFFQ